MVNLAIVGCGYWGINYIRLCQEVSQVRLVAVCEKDAGRREVVKGRFPQVATTARLEEVLDDEAVDALVVATPAGTHYAIGQRALRAGKHVLVEKPLTTALPEAQELVALARQAGRVLMVGYTFLYNSSLRKVKELMEEEAFGRVYYLHCVRTNLGPFRQDTSAVWDLASHDVAICHYLLGAEPEWVSAVGGYSLGNSHEDVAFATLAYPNGILANIHVSWIDPNKVRQVAVVGSRRKIVFDDLNPQEPVRVFERGVAPTPQESDTYGEFQWLVRDGEIRSPRIAPSEPLRNQLQHFLDCVLHQRLPLTDGRMGFSNTRVLTAMEQSMQGQGARVALAEVTG